ncbi:hypothetical protein BDV25DRAFT_164562 [Aspergillus avenaceus]|uniref:Secreted protein n=1 Tax=Aspergillus avenaceus TaxID=36643 RepID=A0A5N6TGI7_ASPAV|nr:hypothetical protein BDV25DRAFT_164562 [Aspergillus avenaceus]
MRSSTWWSLIILFAAISRLHDKLEELSLCFSILLIQTNGDLAYCALYTAMRHAQCINERQALTPDRYGLTGQDRFGFY